MISIQLSGVQKLVLAIALPVSATLLYLLMRDDDEEEQGELL